MSARDQLLLDYLRSRAEHVETFAEMYTPLIDDTYFTNPTGVIGDMIVDLMHLADLKGGTGQRVLQQANLRYERERSGDEEVMERAEREMRYG